MTVAVVAPEEEEGGNDNDDDVEANDKALAHRGSRTVASMDRFAGGDVVVAT